MREVRDGKRLRALPFRRANTSDSFSRAGEQVLEDLLVGGECWRRGKMELG